MAMDGDAGSWRYPVAMGGRECMGGGDGSWSVQHGAYVVLVMSLYRINCYTLFVFS